MDWHKKLSAQLKVAESQYLLRSRKVIDSAQDRQVMLDGQSLINFSSNDYLGFANDPKIAEAVSQAASKWGCGSGSSHLVCGHQSINQQFEAEFADFVGAEAALLFSTGYMANLGVLNSFFDREALILEDKLNHASLIDAARLSRAEFRRYKHANILELEKLLESTARPSCIATDSVFSMDGDIAPLGKISALAESHGALCYFDDAHGFGVLGDKGRGSLDHCGLSPTGNHILLATMGKAMGSFGAVVAADKVFIDSLIQSARPYIYTTALPPTVVAANLASLRLLQEEAWRIEHLGKLITHFQKNLSDMGLRLMESQTAIQPLIIGDNEKALACSEFLRERGFLVTAIRPPTVPVGSARLRISLSAAHSIEDIDGLCVALDQLKTQGLL